MSILAGTQEKICIIVPVLNEEANIGRLLVGIDEALKGQAYSVCVLDDGSTDRTREIVATASEAQPGIIHLITRQKLQRGSQRGSALLTSLRWGLDDPLNQIFVEMDGDLSHRPEELAAGVGLLASKGADVVIASKYVDGSLVVNRPWTRRAVSMVCNAMVRSVLARRVRDYSNGYRFYNRHAAEVICRSKIKYGSPIYLSEVMGIWLRARMRITEIPTTYVGRNEGVSKLRFIDLIKAGLAIFEIAIRVHLTGFASRSQPSGTSSDVLPRSQGMPSAAETQQRS